MSIVAKRIKELDLTKATKFVLPMLYSKNRTDEFFISKYFENCYIGDQNRQELGHGIFILYNYVMDINFIKFERSLELVPEYHLDYDYGNENQVMFVFNIPEGQEENFKHFKAGNFHLFSDDYKQQVLKFWGIEKGDNPFSNILYPQDEEVKSEPIDLDKETYSDPKL